MHGTRAVLFRTRGASVCASALADSQGLRDEPWATVLTVFIARIQLNISGWDQEERGVGRLTFVSGNLMLALCRMPGLGSLGFTLLYGFWQFLAPV